MFEPRWHLNSEDEQAIVKRVVLCMNVCVRLGVQLRVRDALHLFCEHELYQLTWHAVFLQCVIIKY